MNSMYSSELVAYALAHDLVGHNPGKDVNPEVVEKIEVKSQIGHTLTNSLGDKLNIPGLVMDTVEYFKKEFFDKGYSPEDVRDLLQIAQYTGKSGDLKGITKMENTLSKVANIQEEVKGKTM